MVPLKFLSSPQLASTLPWMFNINRSKPGLSQRQQQQRYSSFTLHAVENESEKFEIDQDKARQALEKLDQQLESLSKKQIPTPKIKASDVKLTRDKGAEVEEQELSGSFLAYLSVALVLFTLFYNVFFYTVIKPSVDGPELVPETPRPSEEISFPPQSSSSSFSDKEQ